MRDSDFKSSVEIRSELQNLLDERLEAQRLGLTADRAYMAALEEEIAAYRAALTAAAVTEIAVLRGVLLGRDVG